MSAPEIAGPNELRPAISHAGASNIPGMEHSHRRRMQQRRLRRAQLATRLLFLPISSCLHSHGQEPRRGLTAYFGAYAVNGRFGGKSGGGDTGCSRSQYDSGREAVIKQSSVGKTW